MGIVAGTPRLILSGVDMERDFLDLLGLHLREGHWREQPAEPPTEDSVREFLMRQAEPATAARPSMYYCCARHRGTGEFIGDGTLRFWDAVNADIGWGVAHDRQGAGFGTEIGAALIAVGFRHFGLHRIAAYCRVGNEASRRIMIKLGMQPEGTLREHLWARGEWWSSWAYSLLAHETQPETAVELTNA